MCWALVFTCIIVAASISIPRTSGKLPKRPKPWQRGDCRLPPKEQNKAREIFRRYQTYTNRVQFNEMRARARFTGHQSQHPIWRKHVSTVN